MSACYARKSDYDSHINGPADLQRALAGYFGLVSFLDEQIGKILAALSEAGLAASTRVIYTSDHGDNLGTRGLWGKATMYEESAGIPMLAAGEGVPAGTVVRTPVTLCDVPRPFSMRSGRRTPSRNWACPACHCSDLAGRPPQRPDRAVETSHLRPQRLLHAAGTAP